MYFISSLRWGKYYKCESWSAVSAHLAFKRYKSKGLTKHKIPEPETTQNLKKVIFDIYIYKSSWIEKMTYKESSPKCTMKIHAWDIDTGCPNFSEDIDMDMRKFIWVLQILHLKKLLWVGSTVLQSMKHTLEYVPRHVI